MSTSADALLALNALLSATTGGRNNEAASSSGTADNLTSLLDTLANFSAGVNPRNDEDVGQASSNADIASLLLAGFSNSSAEPEPTTVDDYDRYERDREQKFRDLEAKFSFLNSRRMKTEPKEHKAPSIVASSSQRIPTDSETLAAAGKAFATSAMVELLSGLQKSRIEKHTPVVSSSSKAQKSVTHKRRSRSRSSSESLSESRSESSYSSSESDRSVKARRKKADRKKKIKKEKTKKEKQKNGKGSSVSKQTKLKKNLLGAERKALSEQVAKLKANLSDYDKRHRTLEEELSRLKKQHNEMCRKLQRQKSDPRKDPLISENENLQADIEKHLKLVEKQKEDDEKLLASEEKRLEKLKKQAKVSKKDDAASKKLEASPEKESLEKSPVKRPKEDNVEYFDPGTHWCKLCNVMLTNVYEWLEHLHSQKHKSNMDALDRPWMPLEARAPLKKETVAALKPFKGAEFLMPSTAFYCNLCKEFSGDAPSAEAHLKSASHNSKYQDYVDSNPFYERREMLEKAAAVSQRVEKSASSIDDKKSNRSSAAGGKPQSRAPEPQRVPYKPNESGKIKPFQLSSSSTSTDKDEKKTTSGFAMKLTDSKKPSISTASNSVLKKPHSAFWDPGASRRDVSDHGEKSRRESSDHGEKSKRESSSHYSSDRKRHRDY